MNRVTIVNLAGRAWHVEEAGVDALDAWLDDARTRLASDPDRDELVLDFERAIADRFAHLAPGERDVVTAARVSDVLTALGTVEPVEPAEAAGDSNDPAHDTPTEPLPAADAAADPGSSRRDRRLYRLTGDDAMVAGVCSGLAAYLRVDVTIIRVATVLLTILTSGALIIGYIALALIVPEAKTPEDRAEALGTGTTAQEMLARARAGASPALASAGSLIARIASVLVVAIRWLLLAAIWVVLASWAVAIGWLLVGSSAPLMDAFDAGTSEWIVGLWLTCIAWVPTAVLLTLERGLATIGRPSPVRRTHPARIALWGVLAASFVVAALGIFAIPASHSKQLAGLSDGRSTVTFDGDDYCIDAEEDQVSEGRCGSGGRTIGE